MIRDIIKQPYTNKLRRRTTKNYNIQTVKPTLIKNVKKCKEIYFSNLIRSSGLFSFRKHDIQIH